MSDLREICRRLVDEPSGDKDWEAVRASTLEELRAVLAAAVAVQDDGAQARIAKLESLLKLANENTRRAHAAQPADADWRCECGDLNRWHEAFCYRCGAGQPEDDRRMVDLVRHANMLAEALRLTQEYVGDEMLPPIEGWSWFDALAHRRMVGGSTPSEDQPR